MKIERRKAALMHGNKNSATRKRATKASDNSRSIQVSDEKESEIKRRWVKNCARERTGKLSKKTTKEGGFDANQQGLELGLGVGLGQIGLRFAKKKPDRQG